MKKLLASAIVFTIAALSSFAAHHETLTAKNLETYTIDTAHSSVAFRIRHFVAKTSGHFSDFSGTLLIDRDCLLNSSVEAVIQLPSVDTDNEKRDTHLQQDEYLDAANHPLMVFKSSKWEATETDNHFKVTGPLRIRGITREVTLDVELLGFGEGMRGAHLSGWEARTTIDRTLWGINGGQPVVGNDVEITINIEAIRQ